MTRSDYREFFLKAYVIIKNYIIYNSLTRNHDKLFVN
jgi:hypothetical protein